MRDEATLGAGSSGHGRCEGNHVGRRPRLRISAFLLLFDVLRKFLLRGVRQSAVSYLTATILLSVRPSVCPSSTHDLYSTAYFIARIFQFLKTTRGEIPSVSL